MFPFKVLIFSAALTALLAAAAAAPSWSDSGGGGPPACCHADITDPEKLTKLYNSKVNTAERMHRYLNIPGTNMRVHIEPLCLYHAGVRVTLTNGDQWLIHKGEGFGISSQTVVVDARHMSPLWRFDSSREFYGTKTVSDFVADGGAVYVLRTDNCQHAADRMMGR